MKSRSEIVRAGSSMQRGRILDPYQVKEAKKWREDRIHFLKNKVSNNTATLKEQRELKWK